jgi:hypothetical protein
MSSTPCDDRTRRPKSSAPTALGRRTGRGTENLKEFGDLMSPAIATNIPTMREPLIPLLSANVRVNYPRQFCARDRLVAASTCSIAIAGLSGENETSQNRRCIQGVRHLPTSWPGLSRPIPRRRRSIRPHAAPLQTTFEVGDGFSAWMPGTRLGMTCWGCKRRSTATEFCSPDRPDSGARFAS